MHKYISISYSKVNITEGFWQRRQQINNQKTVYAVYNRFLETGRIDAFKFAWKPGDPNKPHFFWDSDVAKWMEGVAYIYNSTKGKELMKKDEELVRKVDELVDLIEKNQDESGYFNIYFTVVEPENRWKIRTAHELYCAGHLIEAAVAYYEATGKRKFLDLMCKYADHIEKVFKKERSANFITPGHEEIELALVRLYRATGERRYLELAKFFIDERGKDDPSKYYEFANAKYAQDHLPVREQHTAEGHAVRATYLYSAMADIAYEYNDEQLFDCCRKIFRDIMNKKMYITGGIGSSHNGESFTIPYDLPNITAYSESCAGIGLALFAWRMLNIDADSCYSDVIERIMYNVLLSSVSLDGESFFYENPLEVIPSLLTRDTSLKKQMSRFPAIQRSHVFSCSCCPPNILRFISSIGNLIYTYDDKTVFVHQYIASETKFTIKGKNVQIIQQTDYPNDGKITLSITGMEGRKLAVRIPYWCKNYKIERDNVEITEKPIKGYVYIDCNNEFTTVSITFDMHPRLFEASPNVQVNSGRVALQRGPIVYCLEAIDNGKNIRDISIDKNTNFTIKYDDYFGTCIIEAEGYRRDESKYEMLYQPIDFANNKKLKQKLKFIPYYAFANRGISEMIIWILVE